MLNRFPIMAVAVLCLVGTQSYGQTSNPHVDSSGANTQPPYPGSALPDRESGSVLLAIAVNADGSVAKIRPVRTSGFDDLDAAAINGVLNWKFAPAVRDGKAVQGDTLVQIVFHPPTDGSAQAEKVGVSADFISPNLAMEAKEGMLSEEIKRIPCTNGSLSVTLQFTQSNGSRFADWSPVMTVGVGTDEANAAIQTYPAYHPPKYQFVAFVLYGKKEPLKELTRFAVYPDFHSPTNVRLSWKDYGLVIGTAANGEDHQVILPIQPSKISFSISGAAGAFTNAQLFCTPSK